LIKRSEYIKRADFNTISPEKESIKIYQKGQFSSIGETAFVVKKRTRNFKRRSAVQKQFCREEVNL
jgi:hypothetical protein